MFESADFAHTVLFDMKTGRGAMVMALLFDFLMYGGFVFFCTQNVCFG